MFILHLATENVQQFYNKKGTVPLVMCNLGPSTWRPYQLRKWKLWIHEREQQGGLEEDNILSSPQETRSALEFKHKYITNFQTEEPQLTGSQEASR